MRKRDLYTGNKPFSYVAFTYQDAAIAENLLDELDADGYRYWLNSKISPSETDLMEISKRLSASCATVLVLTHNAINDRIINAVVENTVERRCPLVVYLTLETSDIMSYLNGLFERLSQVIILRVWEQSFNSSNSVRQALSQTKGLTEAQAAQFYDSGIDTIKSGTTSYDEITIAMKNISYAATGEYPPALNFLGDLSLEKARQGMESYSTVVLYYKMAAERGYLESIYHLGCLIEDGEGFAANPAVAASYIAIAAVKGIADAQYRFAEMLDTGKGMKMNRQDAASWYIKALEGGDRRAYTKLAYRYLTGDTVTRDETRAAEYFTEAAKDEVPEAFLMLAKLYRDGVGVKKDEAKAEEYFFKAANAGIPEAQYHYALCLQKEKKYGEAFKWLNVSYQELPEGEKVNPDVIYEIAECYAKGQGTDIDRQTAFLYYYDAAQRGHQKARAAVAECYRKGLGVSVNKKAAGFYNPRYFEE